MPINHSRDDFLQKLESIFGGKYNFSKVDYKNMKTKVWVICNKHGDLLMDPQTLLYKKIGCKECQKEEVRLSRRDSQELFIEKCKKQHGDNFYYSKIKYIDSKTPILIGCKTHGYIEQKPISFRMNGCSFCNEERRLSAQIFSTKEFVQKAKIVHGDKYIYKNTKYINSKNHVIVECKIHGEFKILASILIRGSGCRSCGIEKRKKKKTLSKNKFVEKAIKVHGDKYTYNNTIYVNAHSHLMVTCKEHGDFKVTPSNHLWNKRGCPLCSGRKSSVGYKNFTKRIDQEEFLRRAKEAHKKSDYDFSESKYNTQYEYVTVLCKDHGCFDIKPYNLWNGVGCAKCAIEINNNKRKRNWENLKDELNLLHQDKYDYSNTIFTGMDKHFFVDCLLHGKFKILPANHLYLKGGCPKCKLINMGKRASLNNTYSNKALIEKFKEIHGDLYDYSKVLHTHINNSVKIICKKHGEFNQIPRNHLQAKGCPKCGDKIRFDKNRLTLEEIINIFKEMHGNTYDYSEVIYVTNMQKVKIICKKHGIFLQTPNTHRQGKGCPKCSLSKGEAKIARLLDENGIAFIVEYPFKNPNTGHSLRFDFFLPKQNIFIEYDGQQHFEPVDFGGMSNDQAIEVHKNIKARDKIKNKLAKEARIGLIRIRYDEDIEKCLQKTLLQ